MKKSHPTAGRIIRLAIATMSVVISVKVFSMIVGTGPNDYTYFIRPSTLSWLKGETNLFDQAAEGFYFMPWSVLLFAPTLLVPPEIGQGMLSVLTLVGVLMAIKIFGEGLPLWIKGLAATPFALFILLITGNIDGVVLLGICISWWAIKSHQPFLLSAGLWLTTLKPINTLPLLLFVFLFTWHWSWRDKLSAISLVLFSLIISFPMFGYDWPVRYLQFFNAAPPLEFPIVTIWKLGNQLNLPPLLTLVPTLFIIASSTISIYRFGLGVETFALTSAAWMIVTPYALDIHYVLLIPAFLTVARYLKGAAVFSYVSSYLPLLRIPFGFEISNIDLIYPISLWVGSSYFLYASKPTPPATTIHMDTS
ncbi:MAG: DUF2029 domain-containing protein [Chloroflexi bacterium]|nr:DUF2029 domain-containing protein [Chloroflexota bacterium]MCI0828260.1 DUF2029 domain-containing protein [Chloroflexota bacterium]